MMLPGDVDLATAMQGVAEATRLVVAAECHPEERFWRRWWAKIGEGEYTQSRRPVNALVAAFSAYLAGRRGGGA